MEIQEPQEFCARPRTKTEYIFLIINHSITPPKNFIWDFCQFQSWGESDRSRKNWLLTSCPRLACTPVTVTCGYTSLGASVFPSYNEEVGFSNPRVRLVLIFSLPWKYKLAPDSLTVCAPALLECQVVPVRVKNVRDFGTLWDGSGSGVGQQRDD